MMAAQQYCLLDEIIDLEEWTVHDMIQFENHISAGTCPKVHPSVKDLAKEKGGLGTCLLRACYEGDLEAVKKIIEVWGEAVNTATSLSHPYLPAHLGSTRLLGVSPLFVAALGNHIEIVRYLVNNGANVSARTSVKNHHPLAGITPLHGAMLFNFSHGGSTAAKKLKYVETIRVLLESEADPSALSSDGTPTWVFGTFPFINQNSDLFCSKCHCDLDAISLLVEHGMSLEVKCPRLGRTLLHHMAGPANEFANTKIVNLILEKGADPRVRDKHGITPIMTAAIGNNVVPNMFVLEFLMQRKDIPNTEKMEALEVATAVLLGHDGCRDYPHYVEYCLSRSQNLIGEGTALVPKLQSAGRAVEWDAPVNLEYVQQRPLEHAIQSILTRLRIFSSISWEAVYLYVWPYIKRYVYSHCINQRYVQLLDISWITLETVRRFAPTSDSTEICLVTETVVCALKESLPGLKRNGDPLFNFETLQTTLKLLSSTFLAQCKRFNYPGTKIGSDLRLLLCILVDEPDAVIESVGEHLFQIVKLSEELLTNENKLLHIACEGYILAPWYLGHTYNTLGIVHLLLKFGANPDSVDAKGNGPLHYLAKRDDELVDEAARLILDAGAHFDRTNKEGLTAVDVWKDYRAQKNKWRRLEDQLAVGWEDLPNWLQERNVPRLLCLGARAIRSHQIPYLKRSPVILHPFIQMH